MLEKSIE